MVKCVIYSSLCVFYVSQHELRHVFFSTVDELCYLQLAVYMCASQSELRHLQPTANESVCAHMI